MSFNFAAPSSTVSSGAGSNGSAKPIALMDETFDFMDQDDMEEDGIEQEVDDVSAVLLKRFDEAPIPPGGVDAWRKSSRVLRFKLNPNGIDGVGFISQSPHCNKKIKVYPEETKIYTTMIPTYDDDELYVEYVSNLYGIYDALGDEKYYSVPTAGLIKRDAQRQQTEVLDNAMGLTINELELYIEKKRSRGDLEETIFELEEALYILNCLKAVYFSEDYEIASLLSMWANKADPQPDTEFADSVMQSETPFSHPYFWKYIKQLTLRGLYANAAHAIQCSKFENLQSTDVALYNLFVDTASLLKAYPEGSTLEVFKLWKRTAASAASNASVKNQNHPELMKNIKILLEIISGNKNIIIEESQTWYEALVGLMYYHIPSSDLLFEYYQAATARHQPDHTSIWELACVDIFEGNFLQTLRAISSFTTSTSAYVGALCEAKGLLKGYAFDDDESSKLGSLQYLLNQDLFSTTKPSEFLLHSHAMDCLTVEKLVPVGIGLLASSRNPAARSVIAEYLPKYNFKTNDDIEWALTVCASLKLPQIAHVIYRTAAQRSLSNGMLLEALELFARAGEVEYVKHHCWLIFETSLMLGGPIEDDVINALVDDDLVIEGVELQNLSPLIRQTLAPYAVLYRFWKHKNDGSLRLALEKLLSLLKFPHLPPRLFGILVAQLLPFLTFNIPPKVLLKADLLSILKVLDNFEESVVCKTDKKSIKQKTDSDELYQICVAEERELTKNYWINELKEAGDQVPANLAGLIKDIRRKLATAIGRAFMEESYQ
ncbi:CYFA0S02e03862g1_1 [Cyberlindnera fabianii]|uniref:Nuclear pore complex protein Nup85 n=1 Tax=Cyberlindnera fabianii TaxID=36022 RepID=A0A061AM12_CYBFA|nr:Nucleoporin NUP85 [Cyberlindnera fabianii]CDR38628.1 CYFA0S02e03862g1_1 [Cyberlindnera fabianii]